jgi:hypothetical protein
MVKLQRLGKVPTLQEWSRFQANYLAKRALLEDWSDAEDQKLVFTQVPGCFHQKVLTETNRRRRDRAWVRVAVPESLTCQEVLQELERALGVALPRCHMDRRHFVIQCEGPAQQAQLLGYDRGHIDGHPLRIQRAEYSMSGEELLNYVRGLLLQDDELRLLKQSYGCEEEEGRSIPREKPLGGVFAVVGEDRPKSPPGKTAKPTNGSFKPRERFPKKGQGEEKKGVRNPNVCWTCEGRKKPAEHDYRTCPEFLKAKAARAAKSAQYQQQRGRPAQEAGQARSGNSFAHAAQQ